MITTECDTKRLLRLLILAGVNALVDKILRICGINPGLILKSFMFQ